MVNYCRIIGCHNRSDRERDRSFYRLPEFITSQGEKTLELSAERRRLWLAQLSQDFSGKNLRNVRVCSDHFISKKRSDLYDRDNPDWVPSVNTGPKRNHSVISPETADERFKRQKYRHEKTDAAKTLLLLQNTEQTMDEEETAELVTEESVQTDIDCNLLQAMETELQALRSENFELKERLQSFSPYSIQSFDGNDEKVKFFTGLSCFKILMTLFTFLEPFLPSKKQSLGKFECLVITLVRLRLNTSVNQIAYQLNSSVSTISRTVSSVIDVMFARMKPLILWPDREQLRKTMPMQFRKQFGMKCAVIIDCFEVFIERPSNLKALAETWSSYKHHNTVKFLLGITPQGVISFISNSWGGRTSDKHITNNCGFLNCLLPGDIVLADRVFDIQSSVGVMNAEVKIPAFTKGKSQLSALDVETTRKLANVRIHVERVIGLVRQKYTILSGTLPIDMVITKEKDDVPTVDKIAVICCGLVNLCESVVDFN